jgi:hypothetical protein
MDFGYRFICLLENIAMLASAVLLSNYSKLLLSTELINRFPYKKIFIASL